MTDSKDQASLPREVRKLSAAIFDVDGVLLASPHERAWREALENTGNEARFTTTMYQSQVAGKPRFAGAVAALRALSLPDSGPRAEAYAERKQKRLEDLIVAGEVSAFPDALRFVRALMTLGWPMAVASSSKNANEMMKRVQLDASHTLYEAFASNVCGRDLQQGKPNPEIFLLAASELPADPRDCFVVEDAPAGIEAACAGAMVGLGVARLHDAGLLWAAGASFVATSLDEVCIDQLAQGRLCRRAP